MYTYLSAGLHRDTTACTLTFLLGSMVTYWASMGQEWPTLPERLFSRPDDEPARGLFTVTRYSVLFEFILQQILQER